MESHFILNLDTLPPVITQPLAVSVISHSVFSPKKRVKPTELSPPTPAQHNINGSTTQTMTQMIDLRTQIRRGFSQDSLPQKP